MLLKFIKLKFSKRDITALCLATTLLVLTAVILLSFFNTNSLDDWEHLHASWLVWSAKIPYKDFFEHHNPLLWWILAPVMGMFYEKAIVIYAARIFMVFISAITWFFIYKICSRFLKDTRIWIFAVLINFTLSYFGFNEAYEVRPDMLMYMFFWSGLYNYFAYLQAQKRRNLTVAFILFTLSFLSLQKILPILFILGLSGLYLLKHGKIKLNDVCYALPYPLLILSAFVFYLYYNDCLAQYFTLNYSLNLVMQSYYGFKRFSIGFGQHFTMNNGYFSVNFSTFTTVICALDLLILINWRFGSNIYRKILLLLFISELLLRCLTFSPWHQYFIFLNTLALIILGSYLYEVLPSWCDTITLIIYIVAFLLITDRCFHDNRHKSKLLEEVALHQYVIDNSSADDIIMNCSDYINVYRKDSDYIWFGIHDIGWIYRRHFVDFDNFDLNRHILVKKPKFICISPLELKPYSYRFRYVYMFDYDLYELIKKQQDFEFESKLTLDIPDIYAYEFDKKIISKYYRHTPFKGLFMLRKQYQ